MRPGAGFTSVVVSGRYGFSDHRLTGSLLLRHDAPAGRLDVSAWRTVQEVEPWTNGLGLGNTLNGLLAGHDDADYVLSLGGGLAFTANAGPFRDTELSARLERHRSMSTVARSSLNDWLGGSGAFQPNSPVVAGDFVRLSASRPLQAGPLRVDLGIETLIGNTASARGWAFIRAPFLLVGRAGALTVRAGAVVGHDLPQFRFRAGGPETVRGYTYGTRSGSGVWAARLDYGLSRQSVISPVVFVDTGDRFGSGNPLFSVGAGVSFFDGVVRLNVSRGLNPGVPARFDLLFRAPR
jgi:hypothetical protein